MFFVSTRTEGGNGLAENFKVQTLDKSIHRWAVQGSDHLGFLMTTIMVTFSVTTC